MEKIESLLELSFYGNSLSDWGLSLLILLGALIGLRLLQAVGFKHIKNLANRAHVPVAGLVLDSLQKTKFVVLLLIAVYAGSVGLTLPEKTEKIISSAAIIALLLQIGLWTTGFLDSWLKCYRDRQMAAANAAAATSVSAIGFVLKVAVWACIALLILDNLGVNITALVAGLGIGGIAVALAVQNILGDLFASLTIVLDKPFVIGDFLNLGPEFMGHVEYIGLKTTRLRSLSGEQIIISNSDLLASRIRNFGRLYERRALIILGVTYQTPREKLKKIPQIIREAIESQTKTRFDRAHFKAFGAYSIDFEYVYYVLASEYNTYMDTNQTISMIIHERFEQEGIEFAYPTQTLFVEKTEKAA